MLLVVFGIGSLPGVWDGPPVRQVPVREEGSHGTLEYLPISTHRVTGIAEVLALPEEAQVSICACNNDNIVYNNSFVINHIVCNNNMYMYVYVYVAALYNNNIVSSNIAYVT